MAKIYWAGYSCFYISVTNSKDNSAEIVINPFNEQLGLRVPNLSADIILLTNENFPYNNIKGVKTPKDSSIEKPFIISGPGEYEIKGVFIEGIPSISEGKREDKNTIYVFEAEEMRFCHLGEFNQKNLTDEQLERIDSVDILMVPVGGYHTLESPAAQRIISQIEPRVVIPMVYALPKLKIELDKVEKFLKTMGKNSITPLEKLVIKSSNLPKEGSLEIILLNP